MDITLYDNSGIPVAYIADDIEIFLFTGEPVAYINAKSIYTYSGIHLGWFDDGWVRDHSGACVLFASDATGSGPTKPITRARPMQWEKRVKPSKAAREIEQVPSIRKLTWSALSAMEFFEHSAKSN